MSEQNDPEDEEFNSAFDKLAAERTKPVEDAAEVAVNPDEEAGEAKVDKPVVEAARQAPEQQVVDPLAALTPEARELVTQLELRNKALEHAARSDAGRVAALTRKLADVEKPRSTKTDDETGNDGEAFGEDFPEVAAAVDRVVEKKLEPLRAQAAERDAQEAASRERTQLAEAYSALHKAHPDFEQIRDDPKYAAWVEKQPKGVRQMAVSSDPADAIKLVDIYKAEMKVPARNPRAALLEAAVDIPSKGGSRTAKIEDDFDAQFDHFASQRTQRQR